MLVHLNYVHQDHMLPFQLSGLGNEGCEEAAACSLLSLPGEIPLDFGCSGAGRTCTQVQAGIVVEMGFKRRK